MSGHLIISDKNINLGSSQERVVISPAEYIRNTNISQPTGKRSTVKVINLCTDYSYLSMGYYCTLMAEARGHKVIPDTSSILDLNWKRVYQRFLPEINEILTKRYKEEPNDFTAHKFQIFFGRCETPALQEVARKIFDFFRCPILEVELRYKDAWEISQIEALSVGSLNNQQLDKFNKALDMFTGATWQPQKVQKTEKYWIAILQSKEEKLPPSNDAALKKFLKAGKELGIFVELIDKNDFPSLLEYDALFIREGTKVDHHTYRFARKAEHEGLPCIDSSTSILRCANKVFLKELLEAHKIPTPKSVVIDKKNVEEIATQVEYPCVIKIPDGSFSKGVVKAEDEKDFIKKAKDLTNKSDVIIAQEFIPSDFDWRIGILNNKPLYASKYYMAKNHWQIVQHGVNGSFKEGGCETIAVEKAPKEIVEIALKAAALVGDGLYGVDLKQIGDKVVVIEVNDNPSIESGYEDKVLGLELYKAILSDLVRRIEERS